MHRLDVLVTIFPHNHVQQSVLFALGLSTKGVHEAIVRTYPCTSVPVRHCQCEQVARGKTDKADGSV